MVDAALISHGDRHLSGTGLRISKQEASVDAAAQEVLGRVPRDRAVVPREEIEVVGGRRDDVVAGHPASVAIARVLDLRPVALSIII